MKNKTKAELRRISQTALKAEYGFAPAQDRIVLLEADRSGTYILFSVRGEEYRFESHIDRVGGMESIWCGKGTITKTRVREPQNVWDW